MRGPGPTVVSKVVAEVSLLSTSCMNEVDRFSVSPSGRDLYSFTFRLNVSTFCSIHLEHGFPLVY